MSVEVRRVDASPTKAFFVEMITRDISIVDCILDLIDNAVSKEVTHRKIDVNAYLSAGSPGRRSRARIRVQIAPGHVTVSDNAGGMTADEIEKEVFRLGNPDEDAREASLSVYGIGMKRAVFKLGRRLHLRSATKSTETTVDLDVVKWLRAEAWEMEAQVVTSPAKTRRGTTSIRIARLIDEASARLGQSTFQRELLGRIGMTYGLFIKAGMEISVNGTAAEAQLPAVHQSSEVRPARRTFKQENVGVLIIAGITPQEDRVPHGWYVYCNGRLVLGADKSTTTGWGRGLPQFRPKFNHFAGVVSFRAKDPKELPWTTTKNGVEFEARVYQAALAEMIAQARPIIDLLNRLYPNDEDRTPVSALPVGKSTSIERLPATDSAFKPPRVVQSNEVSIQYRRPLTKVDKIRRHLERPSMSASRIGEYTFDYFLERELGE